MPAAYQPDSEFRSSADARVRQPVVLTALYPLGFGLLVVAALTAFRATATVDSDVSWQLWIARHLHQGAHLYRDVIEVNPPLWFWMALPVERCASLLQLRPETMLVWAVGASTCLSLAVTDRLLGDMARRRRAALLAYAALTLMAMPWVHVGQREQIVLIGTLPYAALVAARSQNRDVPAWFAVCIGAGAGLAFALKHYFLIVPALLELWLLARLDRRWRPMRPETVAVVAIGAVYAAAILTLAPEFLTRIVPLIRLAYGETGAPDWPQLFGPFAVTAIVTLGTVMSRYKRLAQSAFAAALAVAGAAFALVYFVQSKGWIYHAIPMLGCASMALAVLLAEDRLPRLLRLLAPALLAFPLFLAADDQLHPGLPSPDLPHAISGLSRGDTVAFLSTEPALPWSVTLQRGYRYPSRYMGYWMMGAIVRNERLGSPDGELTALGRKVVAETVQDFRCIPPRRIIIARPRPGDGGFDILPFFLRDPEFANVLGHYRSLGRKSLDVYELNSPIPAQPASACRDGV